MSKGNLNDIAQGNKNTPWQTNVLRLLQAVRNLSSGAPDGNDLHYASQSITADTSWHEMFPASPGMRNIITDLMVTNGDTTVQTLVEIREESASGTILWSGHCGINSSGFAMPGMKKPIVGGASKAVGFRCATTSAEVVVNANGYKG